MSYHDDHDDGGHGGGAMDGVLPFLIVAVLVFAAIRFLGGLPDAIDRELSEGGIPFLGAAVSALRWLWHAIADDLFSAVSPALAGALVFGMAGAPSSPAAALRRRPRPVRLAKRQRKRPRKDQLVARPSRSIAP